VYTHLALGRLKAVHRMHHPRGLRREQDAPEINPEQHNEKESA
jgi:hypothetical protein